MSISSEKAEYILPTGTRETINYALSSSGISVTFIINVDDEKITKYLFKLGDLIGWPNVSWVDTKGYNLQLINGSGIKVVSNPWKSVGGEEFITTQLSVNTSKDTVITAEPSPESEIDMLRTLRRRGQVGGNEEDTTCQMKR